MDVPLEARTEILEKFRCLFGRLKTPKGHFESNRPLQSCFKQK